MEAMSRWFASPRLARACLPLLVAALTPGCADRPLQPCVHPVPDGGLDMSSRTVILPPVCRKIFTIDGATQQLSAFDPETNTFDDLGKLNCPSSSSPFSMAVARDNTAWVLYGSGDIFHVDLDTLRCTATGFARGQQGFNTFGMGFVSNTPGGDAETLYIASGPDGSGAPGQLGTIDLDTLKVRPLGNLPMMDSPELTGTGQAELWGFTPNIAVPMVAQIDKRNAAYSNTFRLPALMSTGQSPRAWAFAYWGGSFFIFLQRAADQDTSTRVWRLDRVTGDVQMGEQTRRQIVGAGVSSCAPVGLDL